MNPASWLVANCRSTQPSLIFFSSMLIKIYSLPAEQKGALSFRAIFGTLTHPELVLVEVRLVELDDVVVRHLGEDVDLHHEVGQLVLRLQHADLAGGQQPVRPLPVTHLVHLAEGAVAQVADDLPYLRDDSRAM